MSTEGKCLQPSWGLQKKINKYIDKVVCASKSFEYSPLKCND